MAEVGVPINYDFGKTITNGSSKKADPTFSYGLNVAPWLQYDASDNFVLECGLNFMGLNATRTITTDQADKDHKTKTTNMGLNARSSLVNVGALTIGFIYKL